MNSPAMPGSRRSDRGVRLLAARRWSALVVVLCVLSSFPTVGAAAAERQSTGTTLRSEVWRSTARSAPATVPAVDPEPVGRADPFIEGDVRCSWEGHILPDASTRPSEQRERCDSILAALRPARAFVDGLVGASTSRGIELVLLNDPINAAANVAAQTTSVRAGTVACYPPGSFGGGDPDCGGLPPDGPLVSAAWTCQIGISGDFTTRDRTEQRSTLAHEYFHCHQRERSRQSVTSFPTVGRWLIEGSAAWVGEAYAQGSGISRAWWAQAVQGSAASEGRADQCPASEGPPVGCIFGRRRGYSAHSFFFALAARRGDAAVVGATLAAVPSAGDDPAAMATLAGPTDPVWLQWAGFGRKWARGGPSWELAAPGNSASPRPEWRRELALGRSPQVSVEARPTENKIADVSWQPIPRGEQHMVVDLEGFALLRWIRDDGSPVGTEVAVQGASQRLDVCIAGCRGGVPRPPDGASRLVVAVAGTGSTTSRARVSVACPEPTSSSSSPIDALATSSPISRCCLVGDWVMSQAPSYARFRTLGGGTGQTMTIEPDGRLVADYDPMIPWEVQDSSGPEGGTVVMKLNGQATATIDLERLVSARRLRKVDTDFSGVTVTASVGFGSEGTLDLGTQPFSEWFGIVVAIAGEPPPETNVGLECSASTLKLTDSASGISHEFQRVSEPVCDGRSCSTGGRDPA